MGKRIILLACVIAMTACANKTEKEIEEAAQGYLNAMGNYRIEEAAPYATQQTREKTIPTILNLLSLMNDTAYIKSNTPATITIQNTRMISDTLACIYYHKSTPIKEVDDSVMVLFENGKWLVDVHIQPVSVSSVEKNDSLTHRIHPMIEDYRKVKPIKLDTLKVPLDSLRHH